MLSTATRKAESKASPEESADRHEWGLGMTMQQRAVSTSGRWPLNEYARQQKEKQETSWKEKEVAEIENQWLD